MDVQDMQLLMQGQRDEAAAWQDMVEAAPADWARAHGLTLRRRGDAVALGLAGLPVGMFNRVFRIGEDAPLTAQDIAWCADAVPRHAPLVQPTPGRHEAGSIAALQAAGHARQPMRWAKLARSLDEPIAASTSTLRVRELDAGEGALFGRTLAGAMGLPPWMAEWSPLLAGRPGWHLYAACEADGTAVGCAALYMHGASGWLGMAATMPAARNRGAQRALMLRRLQDAKRLGARTATTETGEPMPGQPSPSFNNMLGCGFRVVAWRTNWKKA